MHNAGPSRHLNMPYKQCGASGLLLSAIGFKLDDFVIADAGQENALICQAFDSGITYFDITGNSERAEIIGQLTFAATLKSELASYRHEIVIGTRAGHESWLPPSIAQSSKKNLIGNIDLTLSRLGVDYVDVFYHYRHDRDTPMEETMEALALIVQQGKALYIGLENYSVLDLAYATQMLNKLGARVIAVKGDFPRFLEHSQSELEKILYREKIGYIVGGEMLSSWCRKLGIDGSWQKLFPGPEGRQEGVTGYQRLVRKISSLLEERNQSFLQVFLSWLLQDEMVTTVLVNVREHKLLSNLVEAPQKLEFDSGHLAALNGLWEQIMTTPAHSRRSFKP